MPGRQKITMTDDAKHFWLDGKLYKQKREVLPHDRAGIRQDNLTHTHQAEFVEVNPVEYDKRIEDMVTKITSFPHVDLKDVLRDALYDLTLNDLTRVERKLNREVTKANANRTEPRVQTKRGERGTCVELHIGGYYGMELRI